MPYDNYSTTKRMPFGRFKNWPLSEVPSEYLSWALGICKEAWLASAIASELAGRRYEQHGHYGQHRTNEPPSTRNYIPAGVSLETAIRIVEEGRRGLARRLHPDLGGGNGNAETMAVVNASADYLLSSLPALLGEAGGRP